MTWVVATILISLAGVLAWLFGRHVLHLPPPSNGVVGMSALALTA